MDIVVRIALLLGIGAVVWQVLLAGLTSWQGASAVARGEGRRIARAQVLDLGTPDPDRVELHVEAKSGWIWGFVLVTLAGGVSITVGFLDERRLVVGAVLVLALLEALVALVWGLLLVARSVTTGGLLPAWLLTALALGLGAVMMGRLLARDTPFGPYSDLLHLVRDTGPRILLTAPEKTSYLLLELVAVLMVGFALLLLALRVLALVSAVAAVVTGRPRGLARLFAPDRPGELWTVPISMMGLLILAGVLSSDQFFLLLAAGFDWYVTS